MVARNIFYAQSGGPTAVINASACGVIQAANQCKDVGTVFAGHNGILGALREELIDTSCLSANAIASLMHCPSSAFGSCRYRLKPMQEDDSEYRRIIEVFRAHNIGYFFYNGGGDSQDTTHKISQMSQQLNYPLTCLGIPKTIDNDLAFTDNCPGFGSAAKYIAISTKEAATDIKVMSATSTKVFVFEVMGRHTGWLAAAAGLAAENKEDSPYLLLLPEVIFNHEKFLEQVAVTVKKHGYCVTVVSEGVRDKAGKLLHESENKDAFGHEQLGGVAPVIARLIKRTLNYKVHWAVADYLQRSARHIASKTDLEQAYALGKAAVEFAINGKNNLMLTIERNPDSQNYAWRIGGVALNLVANVEANIPAEYIREDGMGITDACRDYLLPLIQGEAYPPYQNGLPFYPELEKTLTTKKLVAFA